MKTMHIKAVLLASILAPLFAFAQEAVNEPVKVEITQGGGLFATIDGPKGMQWSSCQPLPGQTATVLQQKNQASGMPMSVVQVRIEQGPCKGTVGWLGIHAVKFKPE